MKDPIKSIKWQRLRARVLAEEPLCWICGLPIDHDAPPRSRWSASVDHIIPRSRGGDMWDRANLRACHYGENSARKNKLTTQTMPKSRRW